MGTGRTDEFRKDAVRIALTSGLSRRQVADDLGVGLSTLNKWVNAHRDTDVVSAGDRELARENERLRREIRILKEEAARPNRSGLIHIGYSFMRPCTVFRLPSQASDHRSPRKRFAVFAVGGELPDGGAA